MRRIRTYGLENLKLYSSITDAQIDDIICSYILRHGSTTGEPYLRGHFRALEYHVQRRRIRENLNRVEPRNTALRRGALVSRRVYFVPWPNSLWHRFPPLIDPLGICYSWLHRWVLKKNHLPSLYHK